jgi:putative ABC transport system permease protein
MALGARPTDIFTLIMRRGAGLTLVGIACGTAASLVFARVLASELHGVTPTDTVTYAVTGLVLLAVALAACWLPARRATRVDPLVALRTT